MGVWTTTPWTLPANEAVAVGEDITYIFCRELNTENCMIYAKDIVETYFNGKGSELIFAGQKLYGSIFEVKGKKLAGLKLKHPFLNKTVPIICADHVTTDAGTGAVHTAPGHGQEDYQAGLKNNLPINNPVKGNGVYVEGTHEALNGKHVLKDANEAVIALLKENNTLIHHQQIEHSYPHCWRHKSPLIFRATPQWYIAMDQVGKDGKTLREKALSAIEEVTWQPAWGKERIRNMIESHPGWCVSRQRAWGTPMPLLIHKETGKLHSETAEHIEMVAQKIEQSGIDAWFDLDVRELLGDKADQYEKVSDTLDVWFDSGVSHFAVTAQREGMSMPADLYFEGSDQHRGWFQSSLLTALAMGLDAPYKTASTHGFVVDGQGKKMSKSQGNVISPDKVCKTLGADILRLWVASNNFSKEMTVSDEILKRTTDVYRRIRNTAKYLLGNLYDFDVKQHLVAEDDLLILDRHMLQQWYVLSVRITTHYQEHKFQEVCQELQSFCRNELGGYYLDVIKDRLYTCQADSLVRRSCQTVMNIILHGLVRAISPILSFTAEEIWQSIGYQDSVFLSRDDEVVQVEGAVSDLGTLFDDMRPQVMKQLESARAEGVIGSSLEAKAMISLNPCMKESKMLPQLFDDMLKQDELKFFFIVSEVAIDDKADSSEFHDGQPFTVTISKSTHPKCERCWHHNETVGSIAEHPTICQRCDDNLYGQGEVRQYV